MATDPPLTLEQARSQGKLAEFARQQDARLPKGADPAAFDKLLGRAAKGGTPPKSGD